MVRLKFLNLKFDDSAQAATQMAGFAVNEQFESVDAMFIEDLEQPLGQKAKQWKRVGDIAASYVQLVDDPARKCLGIAMMINAIRRFVDSVPSVELTELFATAEMLMAQVQDEGIKDRLVELLSHHGGVWYGRIGEYHHEAECQHGTARIAEKRGKPNLAAIA